MLYEEKIIETIPVGPLGLIPLQSCAALGQKVDKYLVAWRKERESEPVILLVQKLPVLGPAKERGHWKNRCAGMTYILWLMSAITV